MDTAPLKSFATWARTTLIREVTARVAMVLAPASLERVEQPKIVAALEKAITAAGGGDKGRAAVADKAAYTWFNRIIALRFMDANGYTGIGVVSPETGLSGGQPEILAEAKRGVIDTETIGSRIIETVTALLDGTRRSDDPQGEAYALLLAAYCRHWNRSMPFMFERDGDFTELLVPANLLADDSILSRAVEVLTEDACRDVEVIGWLYQFYIAERKDEVFAGFKKNNKAGVDEIPAATQLFTPHWIVRYLVENSLGRLWMLNRPTSRLVEQMDYYVDSVDEDIDFLKISRPEEIKIIDPACGSGHMLTYAFDLLYAIYEDEGYAPSEIPGLILTNNLYGTEIDPRAGALAAFALSMKARARQRTYFSKLIVPNICVIDSISFDPDELDFLITRKGDRHQEVDFWSQFAKADTLGALIQPNATATDRLAQHLETLDVDDDLFKADTVERARKVIAQAEYLLPRYSVLVANPPYMDARNMSAPLAEFLEEGFPMGATGLDIAFLCRASALVRARGYFALLTMDSWMSSFETRVLRENLLNNALPRIVLHLGPGAFEQIGGQVVRVAATVLGGNATNDAPIVFLAAADLPRGKKELVFSDQSRWHRRTPSWFKPFPLTSLAPFAATESVHELYVSGVPLKHYAEARTGLQTGDNSYFVRRWFEVDYAKIRQSGSSGKPPWVWYVKSTEASRWFAREDMVLNWRNEGEEIRNHPSSVVRNAAYHFREGISFAGRGMELKARYVLPGAICDQQNSMVFVEGMSIEFALGLLNSRAAEILVRAASPSKFNIGAMKQIPLAATEISDREVEDAVKRAVEVCSSVWDAKETSPGFRGLGLVAMNSIECWVDATRLAANEAAETIRRIEEYNDEFFGNYFGMEGHREEYSRMPVAAVGEVVRDLVSYAVGCMFGRYSLNEPGLILADQGVTLQDYVAKVSTPTFMPDADNVIPIVDGDWFEDDIVSRFREFLRGAFGAEHFEENLRFVTTALDVKDLRDYFVKRGTKATTSRFYDDHVQRYKKRPIYWLFSSPMGSFNALIYMHRYTPSTVSTVLNEYLREYRAKLEASLQNQERLAVEGGTPRQQAAAQKEADRLRKVLLELEEYERDLYVLASQQIEIDLDDGVKANYPKFGTALRKISGLEAASE